MRTVCIIGGGPAGLAAAIAVTQSGYRATVVDYALPPIDKACGEGLMPDSLAVLNQLGVTVPPDVGFRFRGIRFSDARSTVAADFPSGPGIGIRRVALHQLLQARAEELGVTCLWGARNVQHTGSEVQVDGHTIQSDFLVAADGQNSLTRRVRGLHAIVRERRRYAFRRHYRTTPWSPYMELHWGPECQIYVTPVDDNEICVVSMARSPKVRLNDALIHFPELQRRLKNAPPASRETGALSMSRKLRRVCRDDLALVGDASGSVDAITGEGLCLSFKQALCLAQALVSGTLGEYQSTHAMLRRRPQAMASLMLTLDKSPTFQRKALAGLAVCPQVFATLLAVHVGTGSFADLFSQPLIHFCLAFLEA